MEAEHQAHAATTATGGTAHDHDMLNRMIAASAREAKRSSTRRWAPGKTSIKQQGSAVGASIEPGTVTPSPSKRPRLQQEVSSQHASDEHMLAPTNWVELVIHFLPIIAGHIDTWYHTPESIWHAAGYGHLMPVCRAWREGVEKDVQRRMDKELDTEMSVDDEGPFFEVNQSCHPVFVARLRQFPNIQSIVVDLDIQGKPAFNFCEETRPMERVRSSLIQFDQRLLEATFTLDHLTSLILAVPSGDRLCALPWGALRNLRTLQTSFKDRVVQGTYGFLHAIPSLNSLIAEVDFFSLPCLQSLTNLTSLDLLMAGPEKGALNRYQAQERSDEALLQISKMAKLVNLNFSQQASAEGIAWLAALPCLTRLTLRLQKASRQGLSIWQVETLLKQHVFHLNYLLLEFKLDGQVATAMMAEHHKGNSPVGWHLTVPWSALPVYIVKGVICTYGPDSCEPDANLGSDDK